VYILFSEGSLYFGGISFHAYFLSSEVPGFPYLAV
jgi:hypothetical protein